MAAIPTDLSRIILKKNSTFGTAADITTAGIGLYGTMSFSGGFDPTFPNDIGFAGLLTELRFGQAAFNASITFDLAHGAGGNALVASLLANESAPTETTGGQGDYNHTIKLASAAATHSWTVAWLVEDDRSAEIPSFVPTSVTVTMAINQRATVKVDGIADRVIVSAPTNTAAEIAAITYPGYEGCVFGGTSSGHYYRQNADGGAGLSSTNDIGITQCSFTLSRPLQPLWSLRGANSAYTSAPTQIGDVRGSLTLTVKDNDDSVIDLLALWAANTGQKAEIFLDGSQIGTGVNRSFKFMMPLLKPQGPSPTGVFPAAKNQRMQQTLTFEMLQRSAAPTGMTGTTNYLTWIAIDTRTTAYTA